MNGNKQVVILCSTRNNIYVEDAKKSGDNIPSIASRKLQLEFAQADTGNCPDISSAIGIVGTPVIDPVTEIMYLFSKGYKDGTTSGTQNGQYKFYAIDLNSPTLADVPGYPIIIDGAVADNDKTIYFNGGVQMNRPSLMKLGNVVYGGFGSVSKLPQSIDA